MDKAEINGGKKIIYDRKDRPATTPIENKP